MVSIKVLKQSVVFAKADAIVNAANNSLLGGGGVDGAIHRASGPQLLEECRGLGGCETGCAKITGAYNIDNAKYIIHTVGPIYKNSPKDAELLSSCYINSLNLAKEKGLKSIAFPCISTGVYGYPLKDASRLAIRSINEWADNNEYDLEILLCCFTDREYAVYESLSCPVCHSHYFSENYEICPVCKWENDPVQRKDPKLSGGANELCLEEYKEKYEAKDE